MRSNYTELHNLLKNIRASTGNIFCCKQSVRSYIYFKSDASTLDVFSYKAIVISTSAYA